MASAPPAYCRELALARRHLLAKRSQVDLRLPRLREHLRVLFLDVVLDEFAQHRDLGVVALVARLHALELADQPLRRSVLHQGLVHQQLLVDSRTHRRIEDFLLDRGVDLQLLADLPDELGLAAGLRLPGHVVEFLEHGEHVGMVLLQQGNGVSARRGALCAMAAVSVLILATPLGG
jgi:hypothetical protein